jgi:hypothetical protein
MKVNVELFSWQIFHLFIYLFIYYHIRYDIELELIKPNTRFLRWVRRLVPSLL